MPVIKECDINVCESEFRKNGFCDINFCELKLYQKFCDINFCGFDVLSECFFSLIFSFSSFTREKYKKRHSLVYNHGKN